MESHKNHLDCEGPAASLDFDDDDYAWITSRALELTNDRLVELREILKLFEDSEKTMTETIRKTDPKVTEENTPDNSPAITSLREEVNCLERWRKVTGLYEYANNAPKYPFCDLHFDTQESVTRSLNRIERVQDRVVDIVKQKRQSWKDGAPRLSPDESRLRTEWDEKIDELRLLIVNLELLVDPGDGSGLQSVDASPRIKTLFRTCVVDYDTTLDCHSSVETFIKKMRQFREAIKRERNDLVRWARENGTLLHKEETDSLEYKLYRSDKIASRSQIINDLKDIQSNLKSMRELFQGERISREDMPQTDSDSDGETEFNDSGPNHATEFENLVSGLARCNENLRRFSSNLSERAPWTDGYYAGEHQNSAILLGMRGKRSHKEEK